MPFIVLVVLGSPDAWPVSSITPSGDAILLALGRNEEAAQDTAALTPSA